MGEPEPTRWCIEADTGAIRWNVADRDNPANTLPHADHVEMSGRHVSVIVRYRVDEHRRLFVERDIFFPQLRVRENDVRGYLRRVYDDRLVLPRLVIDGTEWFPNRAPIRRISFDGILWFYYAPLANGIQITRSVFACAHRPGIAEVWRLFNPSSNPDASIDLPKRRLVDVESVVDDTDRSGTHISCFVVTEWDTETASQSIRCCLSAGMVESFSFFTEAFLDEEASDKDRDGLVEEVSRRYFRGVATEPINIEFTCPDPELNRLFAFCKLRAAESLFETEHMGLVHSPGGGNYYCGIWANDQCEYSGPFFAFLNDGDAHEAAINAYRHYAKHMGLDYAPVPTSFEMGGNIPYRAGGDRGDAAMIASGLARYLLVRGSRELATELYPALQWCNEYNRRKTDARGVVLSDTDELEGRFPTGDANLSTSSLAYDGYHLSAHVARELGKLSDAEDWNNRADALALAIEAHFGATVDGYATYRYYDGNDVLRSWICLPLVFGLARGERKAGTVDALFSPRLWTPDGLATQAGDTTFWDRSTLYGLRGAFVAGATEPAYEHLLAYSRRRLLGDHVPYPVEAYPENAQAHLSAESALYCRVFLEGLLGIVPTGFASFTITPRLPKAWNEYRVRFTAFGERDISIHIERTEGRIAVHVTLANPNHFFAYDSVGSEQETHPIVFENTR